MDTSGLETLGGEMWYFGNELLQHHIRRQCERSLWMWKFLVFWAPELMRALYENKIKYKQWNKTIMAGVLPAHMVTVQIENRCSFLQMDPVLLHSTQLRVRRKRSISAPVCPLGLVASYRKQPAHNNTPNLAKFYYSSMLHTILQTPCHLGFTVILWNRYHYYLYFIGETEVKLNNIVCPGHSGNEAVIPAQMSRVSTAM